MKTNTLSAEHYRKLRHAVDLLGEVQVELCKAEPYGKDDNNTWRTLYHIRCQLATEVFNRRDPAAFVRICESVTPPPPPKRTPGETWTK